MSDDLAPGHGDERPHRVGDGHVREHDDTDETGTRQRFAADGRGRCVDTCENRSIGICIRRKRVKYVSNDKLAN